MGCLFVFILFAPTAIMYSQGYRLNFNRTEGENLLTQTGGIFLKAQPRQAEVFLNDRLKEKTDFFFGSLLIENVFPGKHKIEIKKEGYLSWQKTLEIKEKEVAEAKNVILFPKNIDTSSVTENITEVWATPDRRNLILKTENKNNWELSLFEADKQLKSLLLTEDDLSTKEVILISLSFTDNQKEVILTTEIQNKERYFSFNLSEVPVSAKETEKPEEKELVFGEFEFKNENGELSILDPETNTFEKLFENVKKIKLSPDENKLAVFTQSEVWIFFLKGYDGILDKSAGEKMLLLRLSETIEDICWINQNYLAFVSGNKIKITETDNRDRLNIIEITETKNPEIFWIEGEKRLYILSENELSRTVPLIP